MDHLYKLKDSFWIKGKLSGNILILLPKNWNRKKPWSLSGQRYDFTGATPRRLLDFDSSELPRPTVERGTRRRRWGLTIWGIVFFYRLYWRPFCLQGSDRIRPGLPIQPLPSFRTSYTPTRSRFSPNLTARTLSLSLCASAHAHVFIRVLNWCLNPGIEMLGFR